MSLALGIDATDLETTGREEEMCAIIRGDGVRGDTTHCSVGRRTPNAEEGGGHGGARLRALCFY